MLNKKILYSILKLILVNIFGVTEFYDLIINSDLINSDLIDYFKTKTKTIKTKTIAFKTLEE